MCKARTVPLTAPTAESYDPAPGITMGQIRAAIPKHCFNKSAFRSTLYLLQDLTILATLYALRPYFCFAWWAPTRLLWWNLVGFMGWALFVVGHDCGHGTYSKYGTLNFVIGHLAHTPLLVPFTGWQCSHRKHHLHHNHVENDHSWKPLPKATYMQWVNDPLSHFFRLSWGLLLVYPAYLLSHSGDFVSGNHFNPFDRKLFAKNETVAAAVSSAAVIAWLGWLLCNFSLPTLLDAYLAPYFIFSAWLSLVTFLQHSDPKGVYYRDGEWTYLKGALSTIDRTYGRVIDYLHHDIGTHVVHHILFTAIPHYHLREATAAVKPLLGDSYLFDDRWFVTAFRQNVKECAFVDDDALVVKYQPHEPKHMHRKQR